MLNHYFADMHIHIGKDIYDKPVKITASKNLTLSKILIEISQNKGIDLIGVIDTHTPSAQEEISRLINVGDAYELKDGGIRFDKVTMLLGSEIEVYDENCKGPIHVLCYFPYLASIAQFTKWLSTKMKNINLSTQRYYGSGKDLQYKVKELGGIFIPAHVFTPFKSLYGRGVIQSLSEVFEPDLIDAIELGLSADTQMADQIEELHQYTYLTNSDAHSLPKIAREYQAILMLEPSFKEFFLAIHSVEGRKIIKNFGMNPKLGKYYTTVCDKCFTPVVNEAEQCSRCGSEKVIKGVFDRIKELKNNKQTDLPTRPPYVYQVPLDYLPKLGPKTYEKLLKAFQTEMKIIHEVPQDELEKIVSRDLAATIIAMRKGELSITAGGGGKYGRVKGV